MKHFGGKLKRSSVLLHISKNARKKLNKSLDLKLWIIVFIMDTKLFKQSGDRITMLSKKFNARNKSTLLWIK